ncbi:MAG TPA: hypothetical protein VGO61_14480 [Steroidobacteraceae bacterium]|nr:hypothetical protein [Steroidobacteraceae bacterium]
MSAAKKKNAARPRLFNPQMTQAEQRAELWRLAAAMGRATLSDADSAAVSIALMDYAWLLTPPKHGRPATPRYLRWRIAIARAWLVTHYGDLRVSQRREILRSVLDVKQRAISTVPKSDDTRAAKHTDQWAATVSGTQTISRLRAAADQKRRYNERARAVRAASRR